MTPDQKRLAGYVAIAAMVIAAAAFIGIGVRNQQNATPPPTDEQVEAKRKDEMRAEKARREKAESQDPAAEVVQAIGAFYVPAQRLAETSVGPWDKLLAESRDVTRLVSEAERIASAAEKARDWLRERRPTATTACAKQIEDASRKYAEAMVPYSAERVAWLKSNRAAMTKLLARGPFPEVCDDTTIACGAMPSESDEKFGERWGASYGRVNSIDCTEGMFRCQATIIPGGQCTFPDLTSRLGAVASERPGVVTTKDGRAVNLSFEEPPFAVK